MEVTTEERVKTNVSDGIAEAIKALDAKFAELIRSERAYVDSFNIAEQFQNHMDYIEEEALKRISLAGDPIQITTQQWNTRLMDLVRLKDKMVAELKAIVARAEKVAAEAKVREDHEARIAWIENRLGRAPYVGPPETPAEGGAK